MSRAGRAKGELPRGTGTAAPAPSLLLPAARSRARHPLLPSTQCPPGFGSAGQDLAWLSTPQLGYAGSVVPALSSRASPPFPGGHGSSQPCSHAADPSRWLELAAGSTRSVNGRNVPGGDKSQLRGAGCDARQPSATPGGLLGALPGWIGPGGPPGRGSPYGGLQQQRVSAAGRHLRRAGGVEGAQLGWRRPQPHGEGAPRTPPVMETPPSPRTTATRISAPTQPPALCGDPWPSRIN